MRGSTSAARNSPCRSTRITGRMMTVADSSGMSARPKRTMRPSSGNFTMVPMLAATRRPLPAGQRTPAPMRPHRRCPEKAACRVNAPFTWSGSKPLKLLHGATHYDTPRSLCVFAAIGDAGLGNASGGF